MKVIERIQENAPSLTPAEKKLVQVICGDPQSAALATAADIAKVAEVHEATVSRLVRKLGFDHYSGFRSAMQSEFIPTQEPAIRLDHTLKTSETSFVKMLVEREKAALSRIEEVLDARVVEDAAVRLMAAKRLFFYGRGNAEVLALLLHKRFRRFGKQCKRLSGDMRELAEQVLAMESGDVVVIFAFRRPPSGYAALVESAHEVGAWVLVIAGASGALLSPSPDMLISVPRGHDREGFQTLTVPMTLCNAIVLAAAARDKSASLRTLDRLGALIRRFEP